VNFNEKGLKQHIASGEFLPVYLVSGTEGYLKQHYCSMLAKKAVPKDFENFNFHRLDGDDTSADEIAQCVEALPMMSERTCVLVHDYDLDSSDDADKIIELLQDLPPYCVLIFWMDTKVFLGKKKSAKEILKNIDNAGARIELNKRSANDLYALLVSGAKKRGSTLSVSNAQHLVSLAGTDMSTLINELEKICSYAGNEITKDDIDLLAVKTVEASVFKMVDALLEKSMDKAFINLDALLCQKTEPVLINGALISAYVDMYRAKVTSDTGRSLSDLKGIFPSQYKSDYRLKNAAVRSKRLSKDQIYKCLEFLNDADIKLKSTSEDKRVIFEYLMVKLAAAEESV
jgi:DNA polymerase-3 subunit delta